MRVGIYLAWWVLALMPSLTQAQLWSGVLDSSRATDWTYAGVPGGIPARTTICDTITAYTGTAATINTAIQTCSAGGGGVVQLAAGTFTLSSAINFNGGTSTSSAQNVTLRGAGPTQTILSFSGTVTGTCSQGGVVCITDFSDAGAACGINNPTANGGSWTGGLTEGSTSLTISLTSGSAPVTGVLIHLDQLNPALSDFSNWVPFPVDDATYVNQPACNGGTTGRCVREAHYITAVSGSGPYTVTVTPPIAYKAWSAGRTPRAMWCTSATNLPKSNGVEHLTVRNDGITSPTTQMGLVSIYAAYQSWVKNVRTIDTKNAAVMVQYSVQPEVRDSYIYGQTNASTCLTSGTQYGINLLTTSFGKVENNILHQQCTAIITNSCAVCVIGYNYTIGDYTVANAGLRFGWSLFSGHAGGTFLELWEGNIGNALGVDHSVAHGTNAGWHAFFRNHLPGQQTPGSTVYGYPVYHQALNRFSSYVGNVIGNPNITAHAYQSVPGANLSDESDIKAMYSIGSACGTHTALSCAESAAEDTITHTSLMRWGNYDYKSAAVRWCGNSGSTGWVAVCGSATEIPAGSAPYTQSVPASETLPNSFYLSAKPSWFGSLAWPAIGPDVTGGFDTSGHVRTTPARDCYLSTMGGPTNGSGSVLSFDADSCYAGSDATPPSVPVGVYIVQLKDPR